MNTNKFLNTVFLTIVIFCFLPTNSTAEVRKWNKKMQELGRTFSELLPELIKEEKPNAATLRKIEANTKKMVDLAHTINMGPNTSGNALPPESDPTLGFVSSVFERDIKRAYSSLKAGHVDYAKSQLRQMSSYCISCHTRHDKGPDYPTIEAPKGSASLSTLERADLFVAIRQFDQALEEYQKAISDSVLSAKRQYDWGRAVRRALTIAVRVKKDPEMALNIVNKALSLPKVPSFFQSNLEAWKESITDWKAKKKEGAVAEESLFNEAVELSSAAKEMQAYPFDHSADILYLRSSLAAHEFLTAYPQSKRTAQMLLVVGSAYSVLDDNMISPLPQMYFEACVRQMPGSAIAKKCYHRMEEDIFFGYTGSAGTFIPEDVQRDLNELKKLANEKKK